MGDDVNGWWCEWVMWWYVTRFIKKYYTNYVAQPKSHKDATVIWRLYFINTHISFLNYICTCSQNYSQYIMKNNTLN